MSGLKILAKQTAIFGLSTILSRMLNWLLTPYYTYTLSSPVELGVISHLYALVAFINVIMMFGMETSYFRFSKEYEERRVFNASQNFVFYFSFVFSGLVFLNAGAISTFLGYQNHENYVQIFAAILFFDNIANIPFAQLRFKEKAKQFMVYRLSNIVVNISINILIFQVLIPNQWIEKSQEVTFILLANLIASGFTFLLFFKEIFYSLRKLEVSLIKKMLPYSYPLVIIGLAGMVNETLDRVMLKKWLPFSESKNLFLLGIYNANYKLSIIMTLAIQAFRMGAEPFFFKESQHQNAKKTYAMIMDFFNLICGFIFTITIFILPFIKNIIHPSYHEGLMVVPILLLANWFLGVYYNTSIWYKLTDKTIKGSYLSIFGAVITIIGNFILIPMLGYVGSALVTLLCYLLMTLVSLFWGQKHFFVPYNYGFLVFWQIICVVFAAICWNFNSFWIVFLLLFLFVITSVFAIQNRLNFWGIKIPFLTK